MENNYIVNVNSYLLAINKAKILLKNSIITTDDYKKIEEKMALKYCIKDNSIYRDINLIMNPSSGNMSTEMEG